MKKLLTALLVLALLTGLTGCGSAQPAPAPAPQPTVKAAESYDQVLEALTASDAGERKLRMYADAADLAAEAPMAEPEAATGAANADAPEAVEDAASKADYSGTNVQVEGIDEGDIVKTDGESIFVLKETELLVFRAAGAETEELARLTVAGGWTDGVSEYGEAMFLQDGRLTVLLSRYAWDEDTGTENDCTRAVLYDVSDPAAPRQIGDYMQDGWYQDSRMGADGVLYLISSRYVWNPDDQQPETYIPCTYRSGKAELLPADCIWLPPEGGESYTVISALGPDGELQHQAAVVNRSATVYMNGENLYLAQYVDGAAAGESYTEGPYTVTPYTDTSRTRILRLPLDTLTVAAEGEVEGSLLNQFSMDEYDGNLRVVTSRSSSAYKTYTDEAHGWTNWEWDEDSYVEDNALYVLDSSLQTVGAVEGLGEDERVYSCRFDGTVGYFVTYRETDPLFCVDLSDPAAPQVLSALELPGFSSYLHVWGEGRLLGLGQNTVAEGEIVRTDGLKLAMYDTSDPTAVTELTTLPLEADWSEALYNHHAVLVAPEKNVIAFPADQQLVFYAYEEGGGFRQLGAAELGDSWNARVLYIGEDFYVATQAQLTVIGSDFQTVRTLDF